MNTAETLLVVVRAIHFGASMVLFGEMLFASLFAPASAAGASPVALPTSPASERRLRTVSVTAWACLTVTGASWFALVSMQMSGRALAALDWETLTAVLGSTVFGRDWLVRAVLALALLAMWPVLFAEDVRQRRWSLLATIVSGALLASLAWSGHANAQVSANGVVHHLSDAVHLLAAGAWLGGLAPLSAVLRHADALPSDRAFANSANAATRFGNAAALSVGALVLTGVVNAFYLLPGPSSLFDTAYGRLLLAKLCAFLVMLAIAAVNRNRLTPALNPSGASPSAAVAAVRALRRNVLLEQMLGAAVILLVAALGVSPPPMSM